MPLRSARETAASHAGNAEAMQSDEAAPVRGGVLADGAHASVIGSRKSAVRRSMPGTVCDLDQRVKSGTHRTAGPRIVLSRLPRENG
jgi:hypothetical protein